MFPINLPISLLWPHFCFIECLNLPTQSWLSLPTFHILHIWLFSTHVPSAMQGSRRLKKQKLQNKGCRALCCSCRLSVSSSEESESSNSERFATISSLAHAMVQERLDQMIRERKEARQAERRRARGDDTKFIVMVAMEKSSNDPREDFRESIVEMITTNKIYEPKDLRRLLNCYVSMNSEEYQGTILEVFHDVCASLFLYCKWHWRTM